MGGDKVIKPKDTKQIMQMYDGKLMVGIPADTCWLFKVDEGDISIYAPFPTGDNNYYTAIQKVDGPILPLTKENLKNMVGNDPRLIELIDKGKVFQAIWKYNKAD